MARAVLHSKCVTLTVKYYILLTDGLCGNIANNITTKTTLIRAKKYKIRYSNTPIGFNFNRAVLQCFVFFFLCALVFLVTGTVCGGLAGSCYILAALL